jgi:hypothetical protein
MANENQTTDITAIIKDLMNRRAALDAAITNLLAASGAMVTGADSIGLSNGSGGSDLQPTELPRGAFLNKSLPAAVKLYLSSVVKKQSIKEIATALREGGVESTSDNFEGVITGCVHRMKSNGELLQFKDGWALAERYPAHIRASLSHGGAPAHKGAKKKPKKATAKPKAATGVAVAAPVPKSQPSTGLVDRLEAYVRGHNGEWVTLGEITAVFPGNDRKMLSLNLGKLAKKHGWEKNAEGNYRVVVDKTT